MMSNTPAKPSPDTNKSTDAELIERLRGMAHAFDEPRRPECIYAQAADRMEVLISERDRLKEALTPFANIPSAVLFPEGDMVMASDYWVVIGRPDKSHFTQSDLIRARAALSPTQEKAKSVSIGKKCLYCSLIVKDNDRCGCDPDGDEIASFGAVSYGHDGCEK